jgi:hypothetical protein
MTWYGKIIAIVIFCVVTILMNPKPFLFQDKILLLICSIVAFYASYRGVKYWKDENNF